MEMLIMASGGLNSIASSLGHMEGDAYIISEYCEDVLEEMLDNLKLENKVTRPVRVNIANSKVLEADLLPILSAAKDNVEAFQAIVRLLVNLSMPLEVILPVHPNMTKADWDQRRTLQDMLQKIKKHFVQEAPVRAILEQMSTELEHHGSYRMDKDSMESMNDCLVLIRNILHIEENTGMESNNDIVRHMLDNDFGEIIHSMLSREEAEIWISAMVQVVRLMFRDQMSQDLVKRAAKLYEKGTLFAPASQETQSSGTSPEQTGAENVEVDVKSPWKTLRESSPPLAKNGCSAFQIHTLDDNISSGSSEPLGYSSSDSGFPLSEGFATDSNSDTGLSAEKHPDEKADDENSETVKGGGAPVTSHDGDDVGGQSSETSSSSSGIDSSPGVPPSPRDLSTDEDSLRDSLTGFALADDSSTCSGKESPRSVDASPPPATTETTSENNSSKRPREYLCRPREDPRGSPDSQASEEDDTDSRTSGNDSTFSVSSDNSSSSFTSSSETGSSFSTSSTSMDGTGRKQELLRNRLCKFAVRFCQHGLNRLILLSQDNLLQRVNDCYVLWCMSYFLPFSSLPCISYSDVRYNLSSMVVTYLMFVTLNTWESFTLATGDATADSKSNILFRRLYLLVASLRQILSSTRRFMEKELGTEERESLSNFMNCLCHLEGLRKLYLLLLRKFRPKNESVQYLRALVVGNDELLRIITSEQAYAVEGNSKFNCEEHVKQLASRQVLLTYNELLTKFSSNTQEENEAAFTLMYHTAVDLRNHKLVYQLSILDTFADLWEHGAEDCISQSSWDFMDHIVQVFAEHSVNNPDILMEHIAASTSKKRKYEELDDSSEDEYSPFKKSLTAKGGLSLPTMHSSGSEDETAETNHIKDNVKTCIRALTIKGYKPQIRGLQNLLLETCYAKLACPKTAVVEPVVWLNHIQMKSVPLFAFSQADELAMNDPHFQEILRRVGMHSAKDSHHLFPSIPAFWTAEMCLNAAKMLGDINCEKLGFALTPEGELSPEYLELQVPCTTFEPNGGLDNTKTGQELDEKPTTSRVSSQMASLPKNMWLSVVQQLNAEKEAKA
ncbi:protein timeless-like [Patiria miniata]|uniref:Timeless n=1 Tax=Patiria miniata TaxID=46514 RepID=A0A913ZI09_PATMI|nr:protein timeless-like [Patiria miniata]XP_038051024.1 protein timeless-like [Patiria miniata]